MAEQTVCKWGAKKKKKKGRGWMSCRQGMNCKQRQIKKKGGQRGKREAALDRNPSSGGFRKGTFQQH